MGTLSGAYKPNNLVFTYLPNFSDISKYNVGNTGTESVVYTDFNAPSNPLGIAKGTAISEMYGGDLAYTLANEEIIPTLAIVNGDDTMSTGIDLSSYYYTVSFWVKVNRFPSYYLYYDSPNPNTDFKRKRMVFLQLGYNKVFNAPRDVIQFGAMGPYYIYNRTSNYYKFDFEPMSFAVAGLGKSEARNDQPNHFNYRDSAYTDYAYSLNTWYMVSASFQFVSGVGRTVKVYVNDAQVDLGFFPKSISGAGGNVMLNSGGGSTNTATGNHKGSNARKAGRVAAGPGFITKTGATVSSASYQVFDFLPSFSSLYEICFAPIYRSAYYDNAHKAVSKLGTGVDFGQIYIYRSEFDSNLYKTHKYLYS